MSSVHGAQQQACLSGELVRAIILIFFPLQNNMLPRLSTIQKRPFCPPGAIAVNRAGFRQPVLWASFYHFLRVSHVPSRAASPTSPRNPVAAAGPPEGPGAPGLWVLRAWWPSGQRPLPQHAHASLPASSPCLHF